MKRSLTSLLFLITCLMTITSVAEPHQELSSIQRAVEHYMAKLVKASKQDSLHIKVSHLDSRLKLAKCDEPLQVHMLEARPSGASHTVEVSCASPNPWKIVLGARVSRKRSVIVAARPMHAHEIIQPEDLTRAMRDVNALHHGHFESSSKIIGKEVRQSVMMGAVINDRMLISPIVVKRGQSVRVELHQGGLTVASSGIAKKDGRIGDIIPILNPKSKRIFDGTVVASQAIEVKV